MTLHRRNDRTHRRSVHAILAGLGCQLACFTAAPVLAQEDIPSRVSISWNRYSTFREIEQHLRAIADAYPDLVELRSIGKSLHGRDMWLAIVNAPKTGPHESKPAMWIDGSIHANEVQAGEAVLYTLWYLTKSYGHNQRITQLLDNYSFYLMPVVNPDSRDHWFDHPHTAHSSRHNQRPVDNDRDGLFDEDPPEDLDGDGSVTTMWIADPNGRWIRNRHDPRIFERVDPDKKGDWTRLGSEGIDNDGDGEINEDGPGGDDMNRNWPSDWQPDYVQFGAGPFPFSAPETACIGRWILDHPNIAAVQAYHNAGGMILRGPGAQYRESFYPPEDRRVYDEFAGIGEQMLPYYRSMVIYRDLYVVHGGFVNWTAEGLGIFSFTNELWNEAKYFQRDVASPDEKQDWLWRDRMAFGSLFTDYKEFDHPKYGKVLIGGPNKWSSRSTPTFMLEEECHRNFAFTMMHADQLPILSIEPIEVKRLPGADGASNLWSVTIQVRNQKLIPTRSAIARDKRIGRNDLLIAEGAPPPQGELGEPPVIIAAGRVFDRFDAAMNEVRHEPGRIQVGEGIPGHGSRMFRYIVRGPEGSMLSLRYSAEKAREVSAAVRLAPFSSAPRE